MTDSPKATAAAATIDPTPPRRGWLERRTLLTFLPGLVLLGFTLAVAAGLFTREETPPPRAQGTVEWRSLQVTEGAVGDGATITASVSDERLEGSDATEDSPYVLWMLGSGTYDDRPHVDSRKDEALLGLEHDANVPIIPQGLGERSSGQVRSGQYSPSVDGTITYRDIPKGTYELRALVLEADGTWDGSLATRTVEVG